MKRRGEQLHTAYPGNGTLGGWESGGGIAGWVRGGGQEDKIPS